MKKISFICLAIAISLLAMTGTFAAEDASPDGSDVDEHGKTPIQHYGYRSWFSPISQLLPNNIFPEPGKWHQPDLIPNTLFVVLFLSIFFFLVTRKLKPIPEGNGQTLLEVFVGGIMDFFGGILGEGGRKYLPFVGSFFIFILSLNYIGLIPGFQAPTADLNTTLALGVTAVIGVQIIAIKENGFGGYIKHLGGNPTWLGFLMFPIEIVAQLSRAGSLAIRLFGNIFGEKSVVIQLTALGIIPIGVGAYFLPVPVQVPMVFFAMFGGLLQAFVFTLLTTIYIVLFIEHHDDAHEAHH